MKMNEIRRGLLGACLEGNRTQEKNMFLESIKRILKLRRKDKKLGAKHIIS